MEKQMNTRALNILRRYADSICDFIGFEQDFRHIAEISQGLEKQKYREIADSVHISLIQASKELSDFLSKI